MPEYVTPRRAGGSSPPETNPTTRTPPSQNVCLPPPPTGNAFIFSLENAVCKDSYRRQCREWPEKPIAPTWMSVRILTDSVLYRENRPRIDADFNRHHVLW